MSGNIRRPSVKPPGRSGGRRLIRGGNTSTSDANKKSSRPAPPGRSGRTLIRAGSNKTTSSGSKPSPSAARPVEKKTASSSSGRHNARNRLARVDASAKEGWVKQQIHTFRAWCNFRLKDSDQQIGDDLFGDLQSGVVLSTLLEKLFERSIGRFDKNPRMKLQMIGNLSTCFKAMNAEGINTTNQGAEDVYDKNEKIVLGMLWTLILNYQVAALPKADSSSDDMNDPYAIDISISSDSDDEEEERRRREEEAARRKRSQQEAMREAKSNLLKWARERCAPFGVDVDNFGTSFADGKAFMALSASIDPGFNFHRELVNTDGDPQSNMDASFEFNEAELGIPKLINSEHMVAPYTPDEKSVMTYVSLLYQQHGAKPAIEPTEPEQDLHVEVQGDGLKSPIACATNKFSIVISDKNTGKIVPSEDLLHVQFTNNVTGKPLNVTKHALPNGATEFSYFAENEDELQVRIEFDGEEVATLDIRPKALINIDLTNLNDNDRIPKDVTALLSLAVSDAGGKPMDLIECIDKLFVEIRDPNGNVVHDHTGTIPAKSGLDGAVDLEFTPTMEGEYTIKFDYDEGKCSKTFKLHSVEPQRYLVNKPAAVPITHLTNELLEEVQLGAGAIDHTALEAVLTNLNTGKKQILSISAQHLDDPHQPRLQIDFTPTQCAPYALELRTKIGASSSNDAAAARIKRMPLNPLLVVDKLSGAADFSDDIKGVGNQVTTTIPWSSNFSPSDLTLCPPGGSTLGSGDFSIVDQGSDGSWLKCAFTPDVAGEYSFMALDEDGNRVALDGTNMKAIGEGSTGSGPMQWLKTIAVGDGDSDDDFEIPIIQSSAQRVTLSDGQRNRSGTDGSSVRKTKAVEVVSLKPIPRKKKGVVRVHFADEELPSLLGIQATFKTCPITDETNMADLRNTVLKLILKNSNNKTKKKAQQLCKKLAYCIVEVDRKAEETKLPYNEIVLDTIARFKRDTAGRLQREAQLAATGIKDAADSDDDDDAASSVKKKGSKIGFGGSKRKRRVRTKVEKRRERKTGDRLDDELVKNQGTESSLSSRTAVKALAAKRRQRTSMLLKDINTGAWGKKVGTFKLVVRVHQGENVARPGVGGLYVAAQFEDQRKTTRTVACVGGVVANASGAAGTSAAANQTLIDPEWEQELEFSIEPDVKMQMTIALHHDKQNADSPPMGLVEIPLNYLQPDMVKKAWYVLKKPGQVTTMSNRRLLISLEHHVIEVEPDSKLFFKPAPKIWLEIRVSYPHLRLKVGETATIKATVRDERKNYELTNDLRGSYLDVVIHPPNGEKEIVLESSNLTRGEFTFTFKPAKPGKYKSMLRYGKGPMQRKHATFQVKASGKKFELNV
mmetsp:Transcript_13966/g.21034  ORF Transcript_13966/g.21034 Transcript_13966/m.21034 type:complete len:1349 (+) Transcript_13966:18-4064(+)